MRALKAFLVIMGVFIIAGFVFIGMEVYRRVTDPERRAETDRPAVAAGSAVAVMADTVLSLPAGSRLGDMVAVGNRVIFRVSLPEQGDRLYMLDTRSGVVSAVVTSGTIGNAADAGTQANTGADTGSGTGMLKSGAGGPVQQGVN